MGPPGQTYTAMDYTVQNDGYDAYGRPDRFTGAPPVSARQILNRDIESTNGLSVRVCFTFMFFLSNPDHRHLFCCLLIMKGVEYGDSQTQPIDS